MVLLTSVFSIKYYGILSWDDMLVPGVSLLKVSLHALEGRHDTVIPVYNAVTASIY